MDRTRSAGLAAGTTVRTPRGLRRVETLVNGDVVLTPSANGGAAIPKRVTPCPGRRCVRPSGYAATACTETRTSISWWSLRVTSSSTSSARSMPILISRRQPGWIEAPSLYRSQVLQQAAGAGAQVSSVDPIWRTRSEGLAWIDLDRESDAGWTIDLRSAPPVEARPVPGTVADFAGDPSFLDRYNDEEIAEEWAYECAMHGLAIEDGAPFFVGDRGFVVASL